MFPTVRIWMLDHGKSSYIFLTGALLGGRMSISSSSADQHDNRGVWNRGYHDLGMDQDHVVSHWTDSLTGAVTGAG